MFTHPNSLRKLLYVFVNVPFHIFVICWQPGKSPHFLSPDTSQNMQNITRFTPLA